MCDRNIHHVDDSLKWKKIDSLFLDFCHEPRNLRLGLATGGMNPFGNLSINHMPCLVHLIIYNLSPWLFMKRKYMMLSMMISGPRQLGNEIDVYLTTFIEYLRLLWEKGIDVDNGYIGDNFKLCAMLFCRINDFPTYSNLSKYNVKRHRACSICEFGTCHHQLQN